MYKRLIETMSVGEGSGKWGGEVFFFLLTVLVDDGDQLGLLQCAKVRLVVLEQGMDLEFIKVGLKSFVK